MTIDSSAARLLACQGVVHLDPERAVLEAMLQGWRDQQVARFLKASTIVARIRLVRRFVEFTGLYPWQWTPAEGEAWISELRSGARPLRVSTLRGYEIDIRMFCEYLSDRRYRWGTECQERFGRAPEQVFHEENSIVHVTDYEGDPSRRPLTYDEVQALFDAADGQAARISARRRKGAITAIRDAALLKFVYAYGLRRSEAVMGVSGGNGSELAGGEAEFDGEAEGVDEFGVAGAWEEAPRIWSDAGSMMIFAAAVVSATR